VNFRDSGLTVYLAFTDKEKLGSELERLKVGPWLPQTIPLNRSTNHLLLPKMGLESGSVDTGERARGFSVVEMRKSRLGGCQECQFPQGPFWDNLGGERHL
jgi:hypothetical protein